MLMPQRDETSSGRREPDVAVPGPATATEHERVFELPQAPDADEAPVVAIANRLPIRAGDGGWELSPGGLATALRPVMRTRSGAWVGWDGGSKGIPQTLPGLRTRLLPISLSAAQVRLYYHGFANATLWPRSEERRVGKECRCRGWRSPD